MPLFTWHDGSQKYLHVDVHLMEDYQVRLAGVYEYDTEAMQYLTFIGSA